MAAFNMLGVVVGWQMYAETNSVLNLGLVGLMQFLPRLIFFLYAGVAADRFDRRRLMVVSQTLQALVCFILLLMAATHFFHRDLIFLLMFILGTAKSLEFPATQALLPSLVSTEELPQAIAYSASAMQLAMVIAPLLGGVFYLWGVSVAYLACALPAALGACLTSFIRAANNKQAAFTSEPQLTFLFAGLKYVKDKPVLLGAITLDLFVVLLGGATAMLPAVAQDIIHTDPSGLGLLRAAQAVGALISTLFIVRRVLRYPVGRVMFASVIIFGLATMAFALSTNLWLSVAILAILGAADMVSVIIRNTLVQLETPDAMRGRVSAVNSLCIGASNQLGEFESGLTADIFGLALSILLGGVGSIVVAILWMKLFPTLRQRIHLTQESPKSSG